MSAIFERSAKARWLALSPSFFVIGIFMLIPLLITVGMSFLEKNSFGGVYFNFSLAAYEQFFFQLDFDDNLIFNDAYLRIIGRSLVLASVATIASLAIGFPVAYYIVQQPDAKKNLLVFLITIPFWTNMLIRAYAWIIILGRGGIVDTPLLYFGILDQGDSLGLLYTNFAILIGLAYTYLPLMVLPIYASLEKIDFRLMEAASDLYSDKWTTLRKIVIPLAGPGIIAGAILVFVPALGDFISPNLLGGGKNLTLGTLMQFQFATARNWPFGAAVAVIMLAFVIGAMLLYKRVNDKNANSSGGLGHG